MGRVTINEIAKIANVSKSTISRVLNKSGPVSSKTKQAVLEAIEVLNYQPNEIARSLALQRTKTIGLIIQDIRNQYYAQAYWHTERILRKLGYAIIICNADNDPKVEESFLTSLRYKNVDGVLCIGVQEDATSIVNFNSKGDIPMVLVDRRIQGYSIPSVNLDNIHGGELVADFLVKLGHRKMMFVTSDYTDAEHLRLEGFKKGLHKKGILLDPKHIILQSEELWHQGTCDACIDILKSKERPTAIFASNDNKALRILRLLRQENIAVPKEMSVVGFDDIETASIVHPSLTTVHQPIDRMVDLGAKMLLHYINGEPEDVSQLILEPWLIERESTGRIGED
jgi:DNA-binding LacI/PurR family transcriptional regulator